MFPIHKAACYTVIGLVPFFDTGSTVAIFQDGLQDLLREADGVDGALPRDGLSVHGNAHAVVGIAEHTSMFSRERSPMSTCPV